MINIKRKIPETALLIAGRGKIKDELRDHYQTIETGYISDWQMARAVYSAADIFVIPSILDNLPNTVLESLACGTPVVAFNAGGIPDMVKHGVNGYLADSEDVAKLGDHIADLLQNSAKCRQFGENAVNTITENFSEQLCTQRYLDLFHDAMATR